MLTYALLGFLRYAPQSGYDLKQIMDLSTANFWYAKQSQIYTTLKAMEQEGFVRSEIEPQEARPDRRVYFVTPAGEQALMDWLQELPTGLDSRKESAVLRLFFAAPVGKDALLAQLRVLRHLHEKQLHTYQTETKATIQQFASQLPEYQKDALLWDASRRFGVMFEETYLAWLDETMATIQEQFED